MSYVAMCVKAVGLVLLVCASPAHAQNPVDVVRQHVERRAPEYLAELRDFLSIPNVASDGPNIRRNAGAIVAMLQRRGATTRVIETGGPPVVYGELGDPRLPAILFYFHYDGQPAGDGGWAQPSPWTPVLRSAAIENRRRTFR